MLASPVSIRQAALWAAIGQSVVLLTTIGDLFVFTSAFTAGVHPTTQSTILTVCRILAAAGLFGFYYFLWTDEGRLPGGPRCRLSARVAAGALLVMYVVSFWQTGPRLFTYGLIGTLAGFALIALLYAVAVGSVQFSQTAGLLTLVLNVLMLPGFLLGLYGRFSRPVLSYMHQPIDGWFRPLWSEIGADASAATHLMLLLLLLAIVLTPASGDKISSLGETARTLGET